MATPIEDRVAALETWRVQTVDPALAQARTALTNQATRITALEAQYADAVKRFQKAERLVARLRVILGIIWKSTASDRADFLSRLDPDLRAQFAVDLEEVDNLEHINRREDPDEWREPRTP